MMLILTCILEFECKPSLCKLSSMFCTYTLIYDIHGYWDESMRMQNGSGPFNYQFDAMEYLDDLLQNMEAEAIHQVHHSCGTLMIIMTEEQKRMLAKFGDVTMIDGTYKTSKWGLPLLILVVMDAQGVGYPAAYIVVSEETKDSLTEVILHIRNLVPEWKPLTFMGDKSVEEKHGALTVFPSADWILCMFHVKQAWNRIIIATAYGVGDKVAQECILAMLECIAHADNADARDDALNELTNSRIYQENNKISHWLDSQWLPCWDEWTNVGRAKVFNRGITTNNSTEALNRYKALV
jgi:hypothetical protein